MQKQRWLIISHAYNMDGRAASQTITDKIPHLIAAGIEPVVISAVTGKKDSSIEHHQVLPWGPSGLRFDLRHFLQQRWGKNAAYRSVMLLVSLLLLPLIVLERLSLGLQNSWSWSFAAHHTARKLMAKRSFDAVYTTAGVYSAHLAGLWIKRATGIQWLVEIHDPMVVRTAKDDTGLTPRKTRDARLQQWLEQCICREADCIWWFTIGALEMARKRNPGLGDKGFWVTPGALPAMSDLLHVPGPHFKLCHFGSLSDSRPLAPVLQAIIDLRTQTADALSQLQVHVFGSGLDPDAAAIKSHPLLANTVIEHGRLERDPATGKSGRQRVIDQMHAADMLLLLHGEFTGCSEYIPSKLYEYQYTARPIFAITHNNAQLNAMVIEHGGYIAASGDGASIRQCLQQSYADWKSGALLQGKAKGPQVTECVNVILDNAARKRKTA